MSRRKLRSILLAALLGLLAAPGLAEDGDAGSDAEIGPAEPVFTDSVDVDVVNVDVWVTTRKGEPVPDLVPADFEVLEDGRPVKITNFHAAHGGRPSLAGEVIAGVVEPALDTRAVPVPIEQRLHLVFLIDNLNLTPFARNRVLSDLRGFVALRMEPADRAMVVTLDGARLNVRRGFTNDPDELIATFDEIAGESGMAAFDFERRSILQDIAQAQFRVEPPPRSEIEGRPNLGGAAMDEQLSFVVAEAESTFESIRAYAQRHQHLAFVTLGALQRFVQSMAGLPGRKALVYVSEGLSLRPGEALFRAWEAKFSFLRDAGLGELRSLYRELSMMTSAVSTSSVEWNLQRAFLDLGRFASNHRVTFYGLRPDSPFHMSAVDGAIDLGAVTTAGGGQHWSAEYNTIDSVNRSGGMRDLADETGGFAITNAAGFEVALDKLRNDFDSYYSLGYMPERERDEKRHRIEVRVNGSRKLVVRHRESYSDRSPVEQMQDRTLAALLYEEGANPLEVSVDVAPARRDAKGHQRVPVMVRVPVSNLVLIPGETVYQGHVSIHVAARDTEGRTSPVRTVQVPIRVARDELRQIAARHAGHRFLLEMRSGEHVVVVGVRDEIGGIESTTLVDQPALSES